MGNQSFRVGILGAGQAGERHAAGFSTAPGAAVVGITDIDPQRAGRLAHSVGAAVYTDWQVMLAAGLDILVIALPHTLHVAPAEAAAQAGVHVLVEKPIATTSEDGKRIVEVCARHGVKLATSFVHRFRDESQLLHAWIHSGKLGQLRLARETMSIERTPQVPAWVMTRALGGGGAAMYSAVHGIDRLRWLIGSEVTQVSGATCTFTPAHEAEPEVEDAVAALLTFANGATATLASSAPPYPVQPGFWETELLGTAGMGRIRTRAWAELSSAHEQLHIDTSAAGEQLGEHYNFVRQSTAFVEAIRTDSAPPVTGEDGLAALEIALAIYASAAKGKPVSL